MVKVMVASAIIAIVTLMTSMVRAHRRTTLMVLVATHLLVNFTTIPVSHKPMTAPTNNEQSDAWHPRYRADKQLIHFISKDGKRFAFDKEILRKER